MVKMLRSTLTPLTQRIRPAATTVSETRRTRGAKWMCIRARILRRDGGLCQTCRRAGRITIATQVDHIRELADGGTDDDENLEGICDPCHVLKTNAAQAERRG